MICVLISILTGVSILTVVYPKVVLPVVFILTVFSSLFDSSQQHTVHFLFSCYFHRCLFCCTSKILCICKYSWQKLSNNCTNKRTHYFPERKAITASLQLREANGSLGNGFHALKAHMLNRLMTGRCPRKSLQLQPKFHSLFLQNSFDFQHLKDFKSPRLY